MGTQQFIIAMIISVVTFPALTAQAVPPGAIAHFPGEGNANDIVGGNNGTLHGGASFTPGKVGQAFDVSGTTDYISAPSPYPFNGGDDFSVAVWMNLDSLPAVTGFAVETRQGQFRGWNIAVIPDGRYVVGGRCDNNFILGPASITNAPLNEWHQVTATFDWTSSEVSLYVDGCFESVASLVGCDALTSTDKFFIGAVSSTDPTFHFPGEIDEVLIYDHALDDTEIQSLFLEGGEVSACAPPPDVPSLHSGARLFVALLVGSTGLSIVLRRRS